MLTRITGRARDKSNTAVWIKRVQGIHAQQAGRHDRIVDNGLEYDGCRADGIGGNEHYNQLGRSYFQWRTRNSLGLSKCTSTSM